MILSGQLNCEHEWAMVRYEIVGGKQEAKSMITYQCKQCLKTKVKAETWNEEQIAPFIDLD